MFRVRFIYLFRYGSTALHALTCDRSGGTLPTRLFPAGWQFERAIELKQSSSKDELNKATLAAIAKHGFYLTHAAFTGTPLEQSKNAVVSFEKERDGGGDA